MSIKIQHFAIRLMTLAIQQVRSGVAYAYESGWLGGLENKTLQPPNQSTTV